MARGDSGNMAQPYMSRPGQAKGSWQRCAVKSHLAAFGLIFCAPKLLPQIFCDGKPTLPRLAL